MIRVAFRYGDSRVFARLVCWWDRADTAHCEVAHAWNGQLHECVSSSFLDHGVRGKTIDLAPAKWRIYQIDGDPQRVRDWLKEHEGWGYDWLGLLGFIWRPIKGFLRLLFCSEACGDMVGLGAGWRFSPAAFEAVIARMGLRIQ